VVRPEVGPPVVVVTGELDAANVSCLMAPLAELAKEATDVIIELGRVDFMDLPSAQVVAGFARELIGYGHTLTLRDVPESVGRALALTGLERVFKIEG
jgi:anti-anti-sigma factor